MSVVATDANVNLFPLQAGLSSGLVRFSGQSSVAGDGSGGEATFTFVLPVGTQPFPGKNYWIVTAVDHSVSGAIVGPYSGYSWYTGEREIAGGTGYISRQIYYSALAFLPVYIGQTSGNTHYGMPDRWYQLDFPLTTPFRFLYTGLGPNTNGVTFYAKINGFFASEYYIQRMGLWIR